jgi:hypothetical protein
MPDRVNIGVLDLGRMGYLYAATIAHVPLVMAMAAQKSHRENRPVRLSEIDGKDWGMRPLDAVA